MALLLDTHVWLWSQLEPERLGPSTQQRMLDPDESLFVATVSTLEVARLVGLGRVELAGSVTDFVRRSTAILQCGTIELSHDVAAEAYALPEPFHRDPADRLLVATARVHSLAVLTADQRILAYAHVASHDARL